MLGVRGHIGGRGTGRVGRDGGRGEHGGRASTGGRRWDGRGDGSGCGRGPGPLGGGDGRRDVRPSSPAPLGSGWLRRTWRRNRRWLAIYSLGIGLSLLWTTVSLYLAPLGAGVGGRLFGSPLLVILYFTVSALVMTLRAVLPECRLSRLLFSPGLPGALLGTAGCAVLVACAAPDGTFGVPGPTAGVFGGFPQGAHLVRFCLACAGTVLASVSSTCTVLASSRLLRRLAPEPAVLACVGSFAAAGALTVAAMFAEGLLPCVLMALIPLASWALGQLGDARVPFSDLAGSADARLTLVPLRPQHAARYGAITMGLFLLGGYVLGYAGQYDHLPVVSAWLVALQGAACVAAVFALSVAIQRGRCPLGYSLLCRLSVPAVAVAMTLLFIPEMNRGVLDDLAVCLTFVALMTFDLCTWVIDVCARRGRDWGSGRPFAVVRAFLYAGVAVTSLLSAVPWQPLTKPKVCLILSLFVLIIVIVCLPGAEAKVMTITQRGASSHPLSALSSADRDRWSALIVSHGLTAREAEVFSLLVGDMELSGIAGELGVSRATVHTHVQHVYGKFGIHSHRELLDAVGHTRG